MTTDLLTREQLAGIVTEAVREAMGDHPCRYRPSPELVDHVFGMVNDLGDGDTRRGVETIRKIHTWAVKRIEKDEEFTANHRLMTTLRGAGNSVAFSLARAFVWISLAVSIGALVIFFGGKLAPLLDKINHP